MTNQLTSEEESYLFHALGYEQWPDWHSERKEDRNNFYGSKDDPIIKGLVAAGYMTPFQKGWTKENVYYGVTDEGIKYVEEQFELRKKAAKKPSRDKRRYQAFLQNADYFGGNFSSFLKCLYGPYYYDDEDIKVIKSIKERWNI